MTDGLEPTQPVLTLAIETSNPSSGAAEVALGMTAPGACELLDTQPLGSGERHDDLLMPAIARLFERARREPDELGRVAVSVGPGGYTGLRIATAAASAIGLATGAAVVGVPSACVAAAGAERDGTPFAVALAFKGESAWVTRFRADGSGLDAGRLMQTGQLGDLSRGTWIADRFLPDPWRRAIQAAGGRIAEPRFEARSVLRLAWSFEAAPDGVVTPLYGREAEAVTRWRALHGGPRA
ncbi:MAG: tRNA (adenosine(37)-N6)-threonylcarbamoyltransferase complex dimerization subunit type 1 TsaB [Planctomycetota bacterium]